MTFAYDNLRNPRRVVVDWVSDSATGAVSGTSKEIGGRLIKGVTVPSVTDPPTLNYDIALTDAEGIDLLASSFANLTNRAAAGAQAVYLGLLGGTFMIAAFPVSSGKITVAITNAGNSKAGRLILYYDPGTPNANEQA